MPWRSLPGQLPDPYHVWLSEIMLPATTVATVKGYFEPFSPVGRARQDLAAAELDQVLTAWAGLGYYARARKSASLRSGGGAASWRPVSER